MYCKTHKVKCLNWLCLKQTILTIFGSELRPIVKKKLCCSASKTKKPFSSYYFLCALANVLGLPCGNFPCHPPDSMHFGMKTCCLNMMIMTIMTIMTATKAVCRQQRQPRQRQPQQREQTQ